MQSRCPHGLAWLGAIAGQSVTLCLADEIDCSRGNVLAAADNPPQVADQFEATIVWMADDAMIPGRGYWFKLGTQMVSATVQSPMRRAGSSSIPTRSSNRARHRASSRARLSQNFPSDCLPK